MLKRMIVFLFLFYAFVPSNLMADENTDKAWSAFVKKDYTQARSYTQRCVGKHKDKAKQQQLAVGNLKKSGGAGIKALHRGSISVKDDKSISGMETILNNKELNDVATAYFIEGEVLAKEGKIQEAKKQFQEIADNYQDSYCWDPKGWYWKVGDVAKDRVETLGTKYDYKDYRSVNLMIQAWKALGESDFTGVELYANKCIKLYSDRAGEMQTQMKSYAKDSFIPLYWALNDVGTSYFILGEAYMKQGNIEKAKEAYLAVAQQYSYAQCWDHRGWYWKVAEASNKRLNELKK